MWPTDAPPTLALAAAPSGARPEAGSGRLRAAGEPDVGSCLLPTARRILAGLGLTLLLLVGVVSLEAATATPALAVPTQEVIDNTCGSLPIISEACRQLIDGAAWLVDGAGDLTDSVVAGAFDYFARWVAVGAIAAIDLVWVGINGTTTPTVEAGGSIFQTSLVAARALAFPLLVAAGLYSLLKRDASIALRSAFFYLPGSVLGMVVAGFLVNATLQATDQLSDAYLDTGQTDVALWLDNLGGSITAGVGITAPILLVIFSFVLIAGAISVWLVMVVRSAAIVVTYAFMPLAFAALIFPATRSWIRRLVEIQLSFILAKPVIVAVLSLGSQTLNEVDNALVAMMQAAALFYLAAFSPFALMKLLPFVSDGAVAAMEEPSGAPSRVAATAVGVVSGQRLAGFLAGSQQEGPSAAPSAAASPGPGGSTGGGGPAGGTPFDGGDGPGGGSPGGGPSDGGPGGPDNGGGGPTPGPGGGPGPTGPAPTGGPAPAAPSTGGTLDSGNADPPTQGRT